MYSSTISTGNMIQSVHVVLYCITVNGDIGQEWLQSSPFLSASTISQTGGKALKYDLFLDGQYENKSLKIRISKIKLYIRILFNTITCHIMWPF